jgi:acetoacetyl-CoA synthetase
MGETLWEPGSDARSSTRIGRYLDHLEATTGRTFATYTDLWRWSVADLDGFWRSIWDHLGVMGEAPGGPAVRGTMPHVRWFEGATLSYAEHALRPEYGGRAIVARSQTRGPVELGWDDLRHQVARVRAGLAALGIGRGDVVAAYLPNIPEAVVAMLAAASLGATWTSCSPELGVRAVVDRLGQVQPSVLLLVDGYRYGDRVVDRAAEGAEIRRQLPTVREAVVVAYLDPGGPVPDGCRSWASLLESPPDPGVEAVPFDHPLFVLFSSGTTGPPKAIVHGHGGILLEHLKYLALHHDLGPGDRFFWFTTTSWMMWNFLVSGLLVGATIVLFDGDPGHPDLGALWRVAAEVGVTSFGVSAPFLTACRRAGLDLATTGDLSGLRVVGSTGAPLPAGSARWTSGALPGVAVASISGGTDVCTAFVGWVPLEPVVAGALTCRCLGAAVAAFDEGGRPVVGEQGELVLTEPLPSMPVGFWGDADGSRYAATYFGTFPGMWRHGDWITVDEEGRCVISGRSDATLNRAGVRIGTAELYEVVEAEADVVDSLAVHLEDADGGPGELLLFVQLASGADVADVERRLRARVRTALSPRHVPDAVVAVPAVPRTLTGKRLEVPVKRILAGADAAAVASPDSLVDPGSLRPFEEMARRRGASTAEPSGSVDGRRSPGPFV